MIIIRLFAAALAAILVQPPAAFCWIVLPRLLMGESVGGVAGVTAISVLVVFYAVPFVVLIGVPLSVLLHAVGRVRWWPLAGVGALAGGLFGVAWLPIGGLEFSASERWFGHCVDLAVDGRLTIFGWIRHLQPVGIMALHGLVGATAYYLAWQRVPDPRIP